MYSYMWYCVIAPYEAAPRAHLLDDGGEALDDGAHMMAARRLREIAPLFTCL